MRRPYEMTYIAIENYADEISSDKLELLISVGTEQENPHLDRTASYQQLSE